jgi:hypothetical protein
MPYIVRRGRVEDGETVYDVDELLPEDVGDDAMVEAGSVEWLTDEEAEAFASSDLKRKSNRELREILEGRGVEVNPRLNKDELIALIEENPAAADGSDDSGEGEGTDADQADGEKSGEGE